MKFSTVFFLFALATSHSAFSVPPSLPDMPPHPVTLSRIPQNQKLSAGPQFQRDLLLGNIIKSGLENLHFNKRAVDDGLSVIAFREYLEYLDFYKRFLTIEDAKELQKYEREIDNQITSGHLELMRLGERRLKERVQQVQAYVKGRLKRPFKLESKKRFERDAEKRTRVNTLEKLYRRWDDILLVDVIGNYLDIEEVGKEQGEAKDQGKQSAEQKKKAEAAKKLSPKERHQEAIARTEKRYLRVFERMLREDYSDQLNKLFNAVAKVYDPHTQYLPPWAKEDFNISMSGSLEGIGAVLREDGNYIKVVEIIPGSASWRGKKLKAEDTILKVGQSSKVPIDIVGMRVEDAVQLIRGKKGSEVRLTVKHGDGSIEVIPIIRDVVVIEESYVKHSIIQHKGNRQKFGYIQVPTFYRDFKKGLSDKTARNCTDDVATALVALKKRQISGIILDLRNNGGGSLEDARLMSGLFVEQGPIVQVKNYDGRVEVLKDQNPMILYSGPLVILTNKFSASASEILASAMQDYGRAVIVGGAETHGKGTVQTLLDLDQYINPRGTKLSSPLGSMKLTIQKFYRITGGSTQFKGVTPDIILPDPFGYLEAGEKYHDFPLPWDEVKALNFKRWSKSLALKNLKRKSEQRVAKGKKFQNIRHSVKLLAGKRDDTKISISLSAMRKRREQGRKDGERFKFDEIDQDITVSHVSLDQKLLNQDQKERKEEWVQGLRKDPYITETLHILNDLSATKLAKGS